MNTYAQMYSEFSTTRLRELAKSASNLLREHAPFPEKHILHGKEFDLALKGLYATEELKNRAYDNPLMRVDTWQELQDEIVKKAEELELL